jgi:hypothetical protein
MQRRTHLIIELTLLTVAAAVALTLTLVAPSGKQAPLPFTPSVLGAQPPGAVVLAQEDAELAVALALQPKPASLTLVATVVGQSGIGVSDLHVAFDVTTANGQTVSAEGRAGPLGTYQAVLGTAARPLRATVTVVGPGSSGKPLRFDLPHAWPPRSGAALVRRADAAYRALKTLVTHERLASDPKHVLSSVYRAIAPDQLAITSSNGSQAIVIGRRRWDRRPGSPWTQTTQIPPVRSIVPYWIGIVQDATVLGSANVRGRAAWIVSFAAPQLPAWFTIWIDKQTYRTLELRMTASAHFMHHSYGSFDLPLTIRPPG